MALAALKGRASFRRVLAAGQRQRSNGVTVYCGANGTAANRYGVMVSSKTGRAVVRNKVRRWTRELLRGWDAQLYPGHDLIVLANRPEAAQGYRNYAAHLAHAIKRHDVAEGSLEY